MPESDLIHLKELLSQDKLPEVIEYLLDDENDVTKDVREAVINISGAFEKLKKDVNLSVVSRGDETLELNKIRLSLSSLIEKRLIENEATKKPKWIPAWVIDASIYLILGTVVLIFIFQPKKNLRIKAKILVDHLEYVHIEGNYNFSGKELIEAQISNFQQISLFGDSTAIDVEGMGDYSLFQVIDSIITFEPIINSSGIVFPMKGNLRLDSWPIKSGAKMTISRVDAENLPELISLMVQQDSVIRGSFSYSKQIHLSLEQVKCLGIKGVKAFPSIVDLLVKGPPDNPRDIKFSSQKNIFSLDLYMKDSINLEKNDLEMKAPSFYRRSQDLSQLIPVSTILKGEIEIVEHQYLPLRVDTLGPGTELNLESDKIFDLETLYISPAGIWIVFSGQVDHIGIGSQNESYNPSRFRWFWHNRRPPLIGIGVLLLGLIYFLPKVIRARLLEIIKIGKG